MKVREELLGPPEMVGLGVMEATKTARTFVAAVKVFSPHAQKSDLEQLENSLEEELQRGTTRKEELAETAANLRAMWEEGGGGGGEES
jgi:transposase